MTPLGLLSAGNGTEVLLFEKIIKSTKERGSSPHSPACSRGGCETVAMLWDHAANLALTPEKLSGIYSPFLYHPKGEEVGGSELTEPL